MNYMLWGGGERPNKKMGVNQWEWDTCPILEHFINIKLIVENLFPWVWPNRGKNGGKRKKRKEEEEEKGEEKSVIARVGSSPFCF